MAELADAIDHMLVAFKDASEQLRDLDPSGTRTPRYWDPKTDEVKSFAFNDACNISTVESASNRTNRYHYLARRDDYRPSTSRRRHIRRPCTPEEFEALQSELAELQHTLADITVEAQLAALALISVTEAIEGARPEIGAQPSLTGGQIQTRYDYSAHRRRAADAAEIFNSLLSLRQYRCQGEVVDPGSWDALARRIRALFDELQEVADRRRRAERDFETLRKVVDIVLLVTVVLDVLAIAVGVAERTGMVGLAGAFVREGSRKAVERASRELVAATAAPAIASTDLLKLLVAEGIPLNEAKSFIRGFVMEAGLVKRVTLHAGDSVYMWCAVGEDAAGTPGLIFGNWATLDAAASAAQCGVREVYVRGGETVHRVLVEVRITEDVDAILGIARRIDSVPTAPGVGGEGGATQLFSKGLENKVEVVRSLGSLEGFQTERVLTR